MPRPPQGATVGPGGGPSAFHEYEVDIAGSYIFVPTKLEDAGYRKNPFDRTEDEPAVQRVAIVSGVVAIPQNEEGTIFTATPVADWITLAFGSQAKLVAWAGIVLGHKIEKDEELEPSIIIGRPVWMEIRTWPKQQGGYGAGIKAPQELQPGVAIPGVLEEFIRTPDDLPLPFVWLPADEVERRRERALGTKSNGEQQPDERPRSNVQEEHPNGRAVAERSRDNAERTAASVAAQPSATSAHLAAVQGLSDVLQAVLEEEFGYHTDATVADKLKSLEAFWTYFEQVPEISVGKTEGGGFRINPGTFSEAGAKNAVAALVRWDRGRGDDIRAEPFGQTDAEAAADPPGLPE